MVLSSTRSTENKGSIGAHSCMYSLTHFTLRDMTKCGAALRKIGSGATSMESVADRIVRYLYEGFIDEQTGQSALALVRCFKTHSCSELEAELHQFASQMLTGQPISPTMNCLILLATAGDQPEWNDRRDSAQHQAIPLSSEQLLAQSPMISHLMKQFGLEIGSVSSPDPELLVDIEQETFNVFHVPNAVNSLHIPAQANFVMPYRIESVLGFGGMLPSGHLIAVILFSKVHIPRSTADMFKTLALNTKMAVLPFDQGIVFD